MERSRPTSLTRTPNPGTAIKAHEQQQLNQLKLEILKKIESSNFSSTKKRKFGEELLAKVESLEKYQQTKFSDNDIGLAVNQLATSSYFKEICENKTLCPLLKSWIADEMRSEVSSILFAQNLTNSIIEEAIVSITNIVYDSNNGLKDDEIKDFGQYIIDTLTTSKAISVFGVNEKFDSLLNSTVVNFVHQNYSKGTSNSSEESTVDFSQDERNKDNQSTSSPPPSKKHTLTNLLKDISYNKFATQSILTWIREAILGEKTSSININSSSRSNPQLNIYENLQKAKSIIQENLPNEADQQPGYQKEILEAITKPSSTMIPILWSTPKPTRIDNELELIINTGTPQYIQDLNESLKQLNSQAISELKTWVTTSLITAKPMKRDDRTNISYFFHNYLLDYIVEFHTKIEEFNKNPLTKNEIIDLITFRVNGGTVDINSSSPLLESAPKNRHCQTTIKLQTLFKNEDFQLHLIKLLHTIKTVIDSEQYRKTNDDQYPEATWINHSRGYINHTLEDERVTFDDDFYQALISADNPNIINCIRNLCTHATVNIASKTFQYIASSETESVKKLKEYLDRMITLDYLGAGKADLSITGITSISHHEKLSRPKRREGSPSTSTITQKSNDDDKDKETPGISKNTDLKNNSRRKKKESLPEPEDYTAHLSQTDSVATNEGVITDEFKDDSTVSGEDPSLVNGNCQTDDSGTTSSTASSQTSGTAVPPSRPAVPVPETVPTETLASTGKTPVTQGITQSNHGARVSEYKKTPIARMLQRNVVGKLNTIRSAFKNATKVVTDGLSLSTDAVPIDGSKQLLNVRHNNITGATTSLDTRPQRNLQHEKHKQFTEELRKILHQQDPQKESIHGVPVLTEYLQVELNEIYQSMESTNLTLTPQILSTETQLIKCLKQIVKGSHTTTTASNPKNGLKNPIKAVAGLFNRSNPNLLLKQSKNLIASLKKMREAIPTSTTQEVNTDYQLFTQSPVVVRRPAQETHQDLAKLYDELFSPEAEKNFQNNKESIEQRIKEAKRSSSKNPDTHYPSSNDGSYVPNSGLTDMDSGKDREEETSYYGCDTLDGYREMANRLLLEQYTDEDITFALGGNTTNSEDEDSTSTPPSYQSFVSTNQFEHKYFGQNAYGEHLWLDDKGERYRLSFDNIRIYEGVHPEDGQNIDCYEVNNGDDTELIMFEHNKIYSFTFHDDEGDYDEFFLYHDGILYHHMPAFGENIYVDEQTQCYMLHEGNLLSLDTVYDEPVGEDTTEYYNTFAERLDNKTKETAEAYKKLQEMFEKQWPKIAELSALKEQYGDNIDQLKQVFQGLLPQMLKKGEEAFNTNIDSLIDLIYQHGNESSDKLNTLAQKTKEKVDDALEGVDERVATVEGQMKEIQQLKEQLLDLATQFKDYQKSVDLQASAGSRQSRLDPRLRERWDCQKASQTLQATAAATTSSLSNTGSQDQDNGTQSTIISLVSTSSAQNISTSQSEAQKTAEESRIENLERALKEKDLASAQQIQFMQEQMQRMTQMQQQTLAQMQEILKQQEEQKSTQNLPNQKLPETMLATDLVNELCEIEINERVENFTDSYPELKDLVELQDKLMNKILEDTNTESLPQLSTKIITLEKELLDKLTSNASKGTITTKIRLINLQFVSIEKILTQSKQSIVSSTHHSIPFVSLQSSSSDGGTPTPPTSTRPYTLNPLHVESPQHISGGRSKLDPEDISNLATTTQLYSSAVDLSLTLPTITSVASGKNYTAISTSSTTSRNQIERATSTKHLITPKRLKDIELNSVDELLEQHSSIDSVFESIEKKFPKIVKQNNSEDIEKEPTDIKGKAINKLSKNRLSFNSKINLIQNIKNSDRNTEIQKEDLNTISENLTMLRNGLMKLNNMKVDDIEDTFIDTVVTVYVSNFNINIDILNNPEKKYVLDPNGDAVDGNTTKSTIPNRQVIIHSLASPKSIITPRTPPRNIHPGDSSQTTSNTGTPKQDEVKKALFFSSDSNL
ncbi:MAG: hypothetical protein ACK5Z5_05770 [Neisseriaceae bacterium]